MPSLPECATINAASPKAALFKVTIYCVRAQHCTLDEFRRQWDSSVADRMRRWPLMTRPFRFAQNIRHADAAPLAGMGQGLYDGAEEYWFSDSDLAHLFFTAVPWLTAGHQSWLDAGACQEVSGPVHVVSNCPPSTTAMTVKILAGGTRRADMTREAYRAYMNERHGPLAMSNPRKPPVPPRVEYCHQDGGGITGLSCGVIDSAGAIWLAGGIAAVEATVTDPYYVEVLAPDEANFTDKTRSFSMIVTENLGLGSMPL